ncbi:MAG: ATP-dependent DNA helicase RecG, partial [Kaistella sp.]|nr:ATP-dependent DNA helicase RecG [Kaistella sp.]
MTLETSIEFLKGIGPERAKFIKNVLGISTVEDLLTFYPLRYIDKSKIYNIGDLAEEPEADIQLKGKITEVQEIGYGDGKKRMSAKFRDHTGTLELVWFRYSKWMKEQIPINRELFIFGKVTLFNGVFSMAHPEIETDEKKALSGSLLP